jgi:hypothetical protein
MRSGAPLSQGRGRRSARHCSHPGGRAWAVHRRLPTSVAVGPTARRSPLTAHRLDRGATPTTTTAPAGYEVGRLYDVDPAALGIGANVRTDTHPDAKELAPSIRSRGVLKVVTAYVDDDGALSVVRGQRRALVAAKVAPRPGRCRCGSSRPRPQPTGSPGPARPGPRTARAAPSSPGCAPPCRCARARSAPRRRRAPPHEEGRDREQWHGDHREGVAADRRGPVATGAVAPRPDEQPQKDAAPSPAPVTSPTTSALAPRLARSGP